MLETKEGLASVNELYSDLTQMSRITNFGGKDLEHIAVLVKSLAKTNLREGGGGKGPLTPISVRL